MVMCGNCEHYQRNIFMETNIGLCTKNNTLVKFGDIRFCCHYEVIKFNITLEEESSNKKIYKRYLVWLSDNDNVMVSIEQKSDHQDDIEKIMDYIEEKFGICKMRILSLDNLEEVTL